MTERNYEYPTVHEIPLVREGLSRDTFNMHDSLGELDETGYPPNVAKFARKLVETMAEVTDLSEYRKHRHERKA